MHRTYEQDGQPLLATYEMKAPTVSFRDLVERVCMDDLIRKKTQGNVTRATARLWRRQDVSMRLHRSVYACTLTTCSKVEK